ncbi:unnamed protein product [Lactuca virosa]|uniref:BAH domain-containing protein n=1 Tax=Lactuca virosa TaxID=75947 RepID=A0AAU9LSH8_9ASTR|nr:unnamed protein product [Lactuca virosa]
MFLDGSFSYPPKPIDDVLGAGDTLRLKLENFQDFHLHKKTHQTTELLWVGSWTCKKKRKHYEAYTRSGVKISVHDFVYVLAEENKRLVAYLEDLYEDSRGNKVAVVRWFHKVDEVVLDLPHTSYNNHKEIFFSLCIQDLSIECIDGIASVLSPQHYENFLKFNALNVNLINQKLDPFVCQNQFEDEGIKPFDITKVKGYWNQNIHKLMSTVHNHVHLKKLRSSDADVAVDVDVDVDGIRPKKRLRRLVETEYEYTIGSEVEVLSQDSGIRGVWFKGVVIKKHNEKLKVRYQDIKDAGDESKNLEEWILSSRVGVDDEFGMRLSGRMTVRPSRMLKKSDVLVDVDVGCVVDAWWNDGWWEGIVVDKELEGKNGNRIHVYFPWEKKRLIFGCKDLRYSQEWFKGEWKELKKRFDLVGLISCDSQTKSHDNNVLLSSNMVVVDDDDNDKGHIGEYVIGDLKWNWSRKKRQRRKACERFQVENLVTLKKRKDNSECKFICESSLFCHSVASSTPLIMSR